MKTALLNLLAALLLSLSVACGGEELSDADVLEKVVPSMAEIKLQTWTLGSGFLVEGGYVVTAAHVVWPLNSIDVVFSNGAEHRNVPVVSFDEFSDLAFLGPIDTSAPRVELADTEGLHVGDSVMKLGYARGEPTILRGKLERSGSWPEADVTWIRSTAEGMGGMSGGPMTNDKGEVISFHIRGSASGSTGITSDTIRSRLDRIARGDDASVLGSRRLLSPEEAKHEHEFVLQGRWDTEVYWGRASSATIDFDSHWDVEYGLFDSDGGSYFRPAFRSTKDGVNDACCTTRAWFAVVKPEFGIERRGVIKSSVPLARYYDPDDGRKLQIGDTIMGAIDTPADIDRYTIQLSRAQGIAVQVTSFEQITVTIDYPDAAPYEIVSEQLYFSEIDYRPPRDGEYTISLRQSDETFSGPDGYTLTVSPRLIITRLDGPANTLDSPVGDMLRHEFDHPISKIQIDYPANITGGDREVIAAEVFEQDRFGRTVTLEKRDLSQHRTQPDEVLTVDDYMERSVLSSSFPYKGEKVVTSRRKIETPSGEPVLVEEFEADDGGMKGVRLAYIHEGETGFMAIFYAPGQVFDEWRPVVDYSIGTFSIGDFSVADGMSDG